MKPYNKENIPLAKKLRKNMTPWERKLWYDHLRYYPVRFQRQKALGEYIADFYCAKARLVIELDGGGHYEPKQATSDRIHTERLEKMNLTVLRICNLDVDKNFTAVCEYIDMTVKNTLPQSASLTAPSTQGALQGAKTIYALGVFDGVHLGHQALLLACRHLAHRKGCQTGAVTFTSHPDTLVTGKTPLLINTVEERKRTLSGFGMSDIVALPFDKKLMNLPWRDFLEELLEKGAAGFVCGDDFRFGFRGEGTAQSLADFCRERDLPWAVVPAQALDGTRISSSHIRTLVEEGEMEEAVRFLGHPHILSGTVIPGRGLGHKIGIPTANIALPEGVICPHHGVYACKAIVDCKEYLAVTNIGTRPTVEGHHVTVEPWLLDFEGDLYGKTITLLFYKFLRPEQKFDSLEKLQLQVQKDADETRRFFE